MHGFGFYMDSGNSEYFMRFMQLDVLYAEEPFYLNF